MNNHKETCCLHSNKELNKIIMLYIPKFFRFIYIAHFLMFNKYPVGIHTWYF